MNRLRFLTAGESHGKGLSGILEGLPSGLPLGPEDINRDLRRRQLGYGRGGRMKIEQDRAEILSGVRWGKTIGSPLSLFVENRDWKNWQESMSPEAAHEGSASAVTRPRPGHADLAGAMKYGHRDIRNILERSSARETAMRVAVGSVARTLLAFFGVTIGSFVIRIGSAAIAPDDASFRDGEIFERADLSPVRCPDDDATRLMIAEIDSALKRGDTVGGVFQVTAQGLPPGLGSHVQWDRRLDGRLAQAVMSIQAIKGVEVGSGFTMAARFGSEVMDEIVLSDPADSGGETDASTLFGRKSNHAGGIEGGMTNGMPVVVRAAMKPIPTLRKPLRSVDIVSRESVEAAYERSDICAVPAAAVIAEAMTALILADAFLEKFGGDSMDEIRRRTIRHT